MFLGTRIAMQTLPESLNHETQNFLQACFCSFEPSNCKGQTEVSKS